MATQENRPNIVVDENFLMLEKRLRRRHAEKAGVYSNADAIEQERNGARAFAIAPEAYGDSKFIGGISSFQSGSNSGVKYMTTDDYVAYFGVCHDTFGAMSLETVAPAEKKGDDSPKIVVNRKQVDIIRNSKCETGTQSKKTRSKRSGNKDAVKPAEQQTKIESGKLDAFFKKLSSIKGRAIASVAAFAICCTVAVGGIIANSPDKAAGSLDVARSVEPVSESVMDADDANGSLLSTLE